VQFGRQLDFTHLTLNENFDLMGVTRPDRHPFVARGPLKANKGELQAICVFANKPEEKSNHKAEEPLP